MAVTKVQTDSKSRQQQVSSEPAAPNAGGEKVDLSRAPWTVVDKILSAYVLRRPVSVAILVLLDAFALLAGFGLAAYVWDGGRRTEEVLYQIPVLLALWLAVFAAHSLYDRAPNRRNPVALLRAVALSSALLVLGGTLYPNPGLLSIGEVLLGALIILVLGGGGRLLYERGVKFLYERKLGLTPTILIGEDEPRQRVRRAAERTPTVYNLVGELPLSGDGVELRSLRRELDNTGARHVILAGAERFSERQFVAFLRSCRLRRIEVSVVPSAAALMGGSVVLSQELGLPVVRVGYPTLDNYQRGLKRALDIAGALIGMVAISPLLLTVAAAIKLTSPGPVLFSQKRVGADEKIFLCYKFRSMYQDAERRQAELEALNEAKGAVFKIKDDPRVTPVGHFIRRFSIDELPQLINVLKGEMSQVGPRPLPVRDFELMNEEHKRRLGAMPGMTGYWQISGRSELSFEEMVRLDLYYIENWSLSLDVKIIVRTLGAVLRHEGAY